MATKNQDLHKIYPLLPTVCSINNKQSIMLKSARKSLLNLASTKALHRSVSHATTVRASVSSLSSSFPLCQGTQKLPFQIQTRFLSAQKPQTMEFQAETRKLLDIVTNSIYTDKEVFIRELISNASDALEKLRYKQLQGGVIVDASTHPLEISIVCDKTNKTLTIMDNGIGMSRDELIGNLGTIARSGSKQFVESLKSSGGSNAKASEGIIGQFGVGFYSSFMVSDSVTVESISASTTADDGSNTTPAPHKWSSDGTGVYTIEELELIEGLDKAAGSDHQHGSKITMHIKDSCKEFLEPDKIKGIIQRYSNFASFPIKVDGEVVNKVSALWAQDKRAITEEQYDEFYKYIGNAYDKPKYRLHFTTDAPIDLKCLLFVPTFHSEKFGMGRTELGVNLYSRKVLIESKPKDLLPEWLRFIKGVVDSEDLPLSLSREKPQDSSLLRRIRDVLTRKLLRTFADEMKNDAVKYKEFYIEYHMFLKEGLCQDYKYMDMLSKLLMFESSNKDEGELVSLDDYISRCAPEQKNVYYLVAPNRQIALSSPYYETFKKNGQEVLLLYNTIDDFVMNNMKTYSGRNLVSAETSSVGKGEEDGADKDASDTDTDKDTSGKLTDAEGRFLCEWLANSLGKNKVREVRTTNRLSDSPAIVTDHESGALRRMMKMVEQANGGAAPAGNDAVPPQVLEVNPSHPLIVKLFDISQLGSETGGAAEGSKQTADLVAAQLFDNALMAAGLVEDPRYMIPRLNDILLSTLQQK